MMENQILNEADKVIGNLMLEINRLINELLLKDKEIEALKPYKEKIEEMERKYDNHFAQATGNPNIKKASEK